MPNAPPAQGTGERPDVNWHRRLAPHSDGCDGRDGFSSATSLMQPLVSSLIPSALALGPGDAASGVPCSERFQPPLPPPPWRGPCETRLPRCSS